MARQTARKKFRIGQRVYQQDVRTWPDFPLVATVVGYTSDPTIVKVKYDHRKRPTTWHVGYWNTKRPDLTTRALWRLVDYLAFRRQRSSMARR